MQFSSINVIVTNRPAVNSFSPLKSITGHKFEYFDIPTSPNPFNDIDKIESDGGRFYTARAQTTCRNKPICCYMYTKKQKFIRLSWFLPTQKTYTDRTTNGFHDENAHVDKSRMRQQVHAMVF